MAVTFTCDACGKQEDGVAMFEEGIRQWMQPWGWFVRDATTVACSFACRDRLKGR